VVLSYDHSFVDEEHDLRWKQSLLFNLLYIEQISLI